MINIYFYILAFYTKIINIITTNKFNLFTLNIIMVVYIRHANDDSHKTKHIHDPHITRNGVSLIKLKLKELIKKYGYPKEIHYSPFRRCIDTMRIIIHELKKNTDTENIKLIPDTNLSRYFNKKEKKKPKVSKKTLGYGIPINESKYAFYKRVSLNANNMKNTDNTVWCITHAIVYKTVAKSYNVFTNDHIDFFESFSNNNNHNLNNHYLTEEQQDPNHPDYVPMKERFKVIRHS